MTMMILMMIIIVVIITTIMIMKIIILIIAVVVMIINNPFQTGDFSTGSTTHRHANAATVSNEIRNIVIFGDSIRH